MYDLKHAHWKNECFCKEHSPYDHTHDLVEKYKSLKSIAPLEEICEEEECDGKLHFHSQFIGETWGGEKFQVVNHFVCTKDKNHILQSIVFEE